MIVNRSIKSSINLASSVRMMKYNYVSQKKIDQYLNQKGINPRHQQTTFQKIKYYMYYIRFIMLEGFKQAKDDYKWMTGTTKQQKLSTPSNIERYYRVKNNLRKLAVPFFLNLLPFGNLLIILMLKYSPQTLPSWIQIEEEEIQRRISYQKTKNFFMNKFDISQIDYKTANVEDLKILSLTLTGRIVDGTVIINRMFGKQLEFNTGILSYGSAWLLRNHIERYLQNETKLRSLPDASVEQKINMIVGRK